MISSIKIGKDRSALAKKLEEYKARLEKYNHEPSEQELDAIYKIAIAEELLAHGEVNTDELAKKLGAKYGSFSSEYFQNACEVIQDYMTTGGENLLTGLEASGDEVK